jgi:hypothetical protein
LQDCISLSDLLHEKLSASIKRALLVCSSFYEQIFCW